MKIAVITKEITEEDYKKLRKAKKPLPDFLYERQKGRKIRVKEKDLVDYKQWISEAKIG